MCVCVCRIFCVHIEKREGEREREGELMLFDLF